MQELLISENNGILGNKGEQPSIPLHTTFTVAETTCWFIILLHQQDRTGKNTKHMSTNNLQPLLTDPNNTSHARSLSRKRKKALNRAWLSLSHEGKSSTSRQQDLYFKGCSSIPRQKQACNSPFSQAHAVFHSLVQRKLPFTIVSCQWSRLPS